MIGVVVQTPDRNGFIKDHSELVDLVHKKKGLVICGTDLLSQLLHKPVGEMGVDVIYGNG